jgi:hypothetical protein
VIFIGAGLLLPIASVPSADQFGDSSLRGNECSYNFSWFSPSNLFILIQNSSFSESISCILSGYMSLSGIDGSSGEVDRFKNGDVLLMEMILSSFHHLDTLH